MEIKLRELETKRQKELKDMETRMKTEQVKFEDEIDFCNQMIENLRAKNQESLVMAENSHSTSQRITETEEMIASERIQELLGHVEELNNKLNHDKKEFILELEKEKAGSSELKTELKKVKARQEEHISATRLEKETLKEEMKKVKTEKEKADIQFYQLKDRIVDYERQIENLQIDNDKLITYKLTMTN